MENKTLIYGALAALGVGGMLYLLSLDGESQQLRFNKKVHTLEALTPFAQEMDLDFRCFYVRVYNLILRMKDSNQFNSRILGDLQGQLNIELNDKADSNIKAFNLNIFKEMLRNAGIDEDKKKEFLIKFNKAIASQKEQDMIDVFSELSGKKDDKKFYQEWFNQTLSLEVYQEFLASNRNEPRLQAIKEGIDKLHKQVFTDVLVTPNAEFAKQLSAVDLTRESYVRIQRKIWATLRHDLFVSIQKWKRANPSQLNCPETVVQELWETEFSNFETVRQEIFKLITGHDVAMRDAKKFMLMAYLEFSAVSDTMKFDASGNAKGAPTRSHWPDLVNETAKKHNEYIQQMKKGQFYANIEKDPRKNPGPDEKIDLGIPDMQDAEGNNASTYNRQKSKMIDELAAKSQVTPQANKVVNKLLQKARDAKEKLAKEKEEADAAETAPAADAAPASDTAKPAESTAQPEAEKKEETAQPAAEKKEEVVVGVVEDVAPVQVSQESVDVKNGQSMSLPSNEDTSKVSSDAPAQAVSADSAEQKE